MTSIDTILKNHKKSLILALTKNVFNTVNETMKDEQYLKLSEHAKETHKAAQLYEVSKYIDQYKKGGSYCANPDNIGKAKFVKWLDENYKSAKYDILNDIKNFNHDKNPDELRKTIENHLKNHVDAEKIARTEAEKIRTDTKMSVMRSNGVKYVRYVAVMDSRVRPSHAALNGKIFKITDAPILGEPNCRCTYAPATEKEAKSQGIDTTEETQEWLNSDDGIETGINNAIKASKDTENRRELFREYMKIQDPDKRLEAMKGSIYKPEWLRVPIEDLIDLSPDLFKTYEETQEEVNKIFENAPIKVKNDIDYGELKIANDNYGVTWTKEAMDNLKKDLKIADEEVLKDFPFLNKYVTAIQPADTKSPFAMQMWRGSRELEININPEIRERYNERFGKKEEYIINDTLLKIPFTTVDANHTITHEFGHAISGHFEYFMKLSGRSKYLFPKKSEDVCSGEFWDEFFKRNPQFGKRGRKKKKPLSDEFREKYTVSKYADVDSEEFIAECFGDYYQKGENSADISKAVVNTFKQLYKEYNLTSERALLMTDPRYIHMWSRLLDMRFGTLKEKWRDALQKFSIGKDDEIDPEILKEINDDLKRYENEPPLVHPKPKIQKERRLIG